MEVCPKDGEGGEIVSVSVDAERMGELAPYHEETSRGR
jgi:hypothetical protein